MVADIGHRYISEGAKGSALEHKKIGRLIANGDHPQAPSRYRATLARSHPRPIYGAFCTFDIFYCRSPLFVLFMFLLGATLGSSHSALALAWPASTPKVLRPLSREIYPSLPLPLPSSPHGRPLDITEDLLLMQTRRYIKTIYFGNAVPEWVRNRALAIK